jgi:hypothetical protein
MHESLSSSELEIVRLFTVYRTRHMFDRTSGHLSLCGYTFVRILWSGTDISPYF